MWFVLFKSNKTQCVKMASLNFALLVCFPGIGAEKLPFLMQPRKQLLRSPHDWPHDLFSGFGPKTPIDDDQQKQTSADQGLRPNSVDKSGRAPDRTKVRAWFCIMSVLPWHTQNLKVSWSHCGLATPNGQNHWPAVPFTTQGGADGDGVGQSLPPPLRFQGIASDHLTGLGIAIT